MWERTPKQGKREALRTQKQPSQRLTGGREAEREVELRGTPEMVVSCDQILFQYVDTQYSQQDLVLLGVLFCFVLLALPSPVAFFSLHG